VVTDQGARQAFADLARASGHDEVYVQRMASPGTSCVFEISDDPSFGSLLSFGLSGMATELLGDRAYRVLPVSTVDAAELVRAPRAAPLLAGYRGEPPARLDGLEDLAVRLSRLASDLSEIRSLVLDPVIAGPDGVAVGGARVVVGAPPTREETGPRRLQ
jgi:acyl-CoA synthetase (NDP forming)